MKILDRRNLIEDSELETVNEKLHISVLKRWALPEVMHDIPENKETKQRYRPVNVAAVIANKGVPIVDLQGEEIPPDKVEWPEI